LGTKSGTKSEERRGDRAEREVVVPARLDHQPSVLGRQLQIDVPGVIGGHVERFSAAGGRAFVHHYRGR
jgi:hypothetical protein